METNHRFTFHMGPAVTALLFSLMLPARLLTELDILYNLARRLHLPSAALRVVNLAENLLVLALAFGLAYLAASALWSGLRRYAPHPLPPRPAGSVLRRTLVYALPCLLAWSVYLYAYWPGVFTSDSFDQWDQAHNLALLYDWHPVAHTLLIFLLTRLWDNPAMLVITQVLGMALVWGWVMAYFEGQGITRKILLPITLVFALLPYNGILLVSAWKDIPYTIANLLLVFLLGRVILSQGEWLDHRWHGLLLGLVLAAVYLLRHNGLVVVALALPLLLAFYARRWRATLPSGVAALAIILIVQNVIAFGLLKAKPNDPASAYAVPIQHISAVIHSGAPYSPQEQAILERIAPMQAWNKAYLRYSADNLSKPWGYLKDTQVLEKIDRNRADLLRVFVALAERNPRVVLASELDLTTIIWRITPPANPEYREYRPLFNLTSVERAGKTVQPQFAQVHQGTGLKAFLDNLLTASTENNFTDVFLWEGGLYLFLSLAFGLFGIYRHGWRFMLLLAPALANAASLALSMPGESFRFVYPIVAPTALIVLFAVCQRKE